MWRHTFSVVLCLFCAALLVSAESGLPTDPAPCAATTCEVGWTCVEGEGCVDNCQVAPPECESGHQCIGGDCQDIDECRLQTFDADGTLIPICGRGEICENTDGSYICVPDSDACAAVTCPEGWGCEHGVCYDTCRDIEIFCSEGYECRDGGCKDINECMIPHLVPICERGQVCVNRLPPDNYECIPDPGCADDEIFNPATGACEPQVTLCDTLACERGFICMDGRCQDECEFIDLACEEGYECKYGGCVDIDECSFVTFAPICNDTFYCVNEPGGFRCDPDLCVGVRCGEEEVCNSATGECEEMISVCFGLECPRGQHCDPAVGGCVGDDISICFGLECNYGEVCDPATGTCVPEEISICFGLECLPGQHCDPDSGSCIDDDITICFGLECPEGQFCDPAVGRCVSEDGSDDACARTLCPEGTICRDGVCYDDEDDGPPVEDECATVLCPEGWYCRGGECRDVCEIIRIACEDGFECRDGGCQPIRDPCEGVRCRQGYMCQEGECVDIDECEVEDWLELDRLCPGKVCVNTEGSYRCRKDFCEEKRCRQGKYCVNYKQRGVCLTDFCSTIRCPAQSVCVNLPSRPKCVKWDWFLDIDADEGEDDDDFERAMAAAERETEELEAEASPTLAASSDSTVLILAICIPLCVVVLMIGAYFKVKSGKRQSCWRFPSFTPAANNAGHAEICIEVPQETMSEPTMEPDEARAAPAANVASL